MSFQGPIMASRYALAISDFWWYCQLSLTYKKKLTYMYLFSVVIFHCLIIFFDIKYHLILTHLYQHHHYNNFSVPIWDSFCPCAPVFSEIRLKPGSYILQMWSEFWRHMAVAANSTVASYLLRICDVKICFAFAGNMNPLPLLRSLRPTN